ncbi:hypothetical protein ABPG74_015460 [Tetrahymena malaccensis]
MMNNFQIVDKLFKHENKNNSNSYQVSCSELSQNLRNLNEQQQTYFTLNLESETSLMSVTSEEEYEMDNLLNTFDSITKNNMNKNIIKAFFAFLLDKQNIDLITDFAENGTLESSQALKKAKNFCQKFNNNNKYLQKLILHPIYGKIFEFYLTFEAQKWLYESKVQEKDKHLVYINFLKLSCANKIYLNNLVKYNKPKKSKFNDRV